MRSAMCLAMAVLVLFVGPAPADAGPDSGANAALKYWQAFATLPGFTAAEQAKLTAECLTMPLDAQAQRSVTSATYALDMMRRGAKLPRCDWAIGWADEGLFNRLPYRILCNESGIIHPRSADLSRAVIGPPAVSAPAGACRAARGWVARR